MSYFRRLAVQSGLAPSARSVGSPAAPDLGASDIVELHAERDAPSRAAAAPVHAAEAPSAQDAAPSSPSTAHATIVASSGVAPAESARSHGVPVPGADDPMEALSPTPLDADARTIPASRRSSAPDTSPRPSADGRDAAPTAAARSEQADADFRFASDPSRAAARAATTADAGSDAGQTSRAPGASVDRRGASARTITAADPAVPSVQPAARETADRAPSTNARPATGGPKARASRDGIAEGAEANGLSAIVAAARAASATRPSTANVAPPVPSRVEIRIGRVTVDVHAAPPAAPIAPPVVVRTMAPAQPAFAPSRHYLRMD